MRDYRGQEGGKLDPERRVLYGGGDGWNEEENEWIVTDVASKLEESQ